MTKMVYQCCVCNRFRLANGAHIPIILNHIPGALVSHGYCLNCTDNLIKIHRERKIARDATDYEYC